LLHATEICPSTLGKLPILLFTQGPADPKTFSKRVRRLSYHATRSILPTGVVPLTTVPTFLRTGPSTSVTIRYVDGSEAAVRPGSLKAYVTERENPGNEKGVERVEVTCPARHLADGLVLVDTPGIGSAEKEATERAFGFLPRVDAGLVVLSADPPIGELELKLVGRTAELTPHLFFVFNKVDLHPEETWREAMDYSRQRVARALDREAEDLPFFAVSARRALEAVEGEGETDEAAGLDALGEMLRDLGGRRAEEVARDVASRRLERLAAEGLGLLDLEEAALRTPMAELEERAAAVRQRRGGLDHYLEEVPALARSAAERAVEAAGRSLYRTASGAAPDLAAEIRAEVGKGGAGNRALTDGVRDLAARFVQERFDAWQEEDGRRIAELFRSDLARLAGRLDEELAGVREWVAEQFGIDLPEHVPARQLAESRDFYYRVEGVSGRKSKGQVKTESSENVGPGRGQAASRNLSGFIEVEQKAANTRSLPTGFRDGCPCRPDGGVPACLRTPRPSPRSYASLHSTRPARASRVYLPLRHHRSRSGHRGRERGQRHRIFAHRS